MIGSPFLGDSLRLTTWPVRIRNNFTLLLCFKEHKYFWFFMRTRTRFQVVTSIFCELDISRKRQRQKCHTGKAAVPDLLPKSFGAFEKSQELCCVLLQSKVHHAVLRVFCQHKFESRMSFFLCLNMGSCNS